MNTPTTKLGSPSKRKPRGPNAFKQHDVTRAVRAAKAAGIDVARIEIDKSGSGRAALRAMLPDL
jgi:hypothetical protein